MPVPILKFSYIWWYLIYYFKIFFLLVPLIPILWSRWFCSLSFFYTDCVIGEWNLQRSLANETSDSVYDSQSLELCVCTPSWCLCPCPLFSSNFVGLSLWPYHPERAGSCLTWLVWPGAQASVSSKLPWWSQCAATFKNLRARSLWEGMPGGRRASLLCSVILAAGNGQEAVREWSALSNVRWRESQYPPAHTTSITQDLPLHWTAHLDLP